MRISIKPLSVNEAWKGRRYRSDLYIQYKRDVTFLLPKIKVPTGALKISITFGFSSKGSDIDNPLKPFLDILQNKYGFNDNRIYELNVKKVNVKKGYEFIEFELKEIRDKIKNLK